MVGLVRLALLSKSQEDELDLSGVPRSYIRTFLPEASLATTGVPPEPKSGDVRLIHAGRLSEEKGSLLLVDVCTRLRDAHVPFQAEIIGSADPVVWDQISKSIDDNGLSKHVSLLGYMPVPDLLRHLGHSDFLIHLSRSDSYPLIVLEGIACSSTPICLDMPGARSMIESYGGHIVGNSDPAGDAADIIGSINIAEVRRCALAASKLVRSQFNWASSAEVLDTALRQCISDRMAQKMTSR